MSPGDRSRSRSDSRAGGGLVAEELLGRLALAEVDLGAVVTVRDAHKRAFRQANGFSLSFLPFVVHATVRALREFPALNASVLEDAIVEKRDLHIGIAVETEKGLLVPVVRHADRLSLSGLAEAIEDLSGRARSRKLMPDELRGGTFTLTSVGSIGGVFATPILNVPEVAILGVNAIRDAAVVRNGEVVVRKMMYLSPSFDHRVIDGAVGARFIAALKQVLENPEALLLELS